MSTNISSTINQLGTNLSSQTGTNNQTNLSSTNEKDPNKIDFQELLQSSNEEIKKDRAAQGQHKGSVFTGEETEEEFFSKLSNQGKPKREDPKNVLNKDDFLKLFITQLSNQDPLKPEDSSEMSARLAQFNSLEQMMNMNSSLNKLIEMQSGKENFDLIKYIGKEVKLSQGQLNVDGSTSTSNPQHIKFSLPQDASRCSVDIIDESGKTIISKELGTCPKGDHSFDWDGLLENNQKAPTGVYHFTIKAHDINGSSIVPETNSTVKITGIDIKDPSSPLISSSGKIRLEDISSIEDSSVSQSNTVTPPPAPKVSQESSSKSTKTQPIPQIYQNNKIPG